MGLGRQREPPVSSQPFVMTSGSFRLSWKVVEHWRGRAPRWGAWGRVGAERGLRSGEAESTAGLALTPKQMHLQLRSLILLGAEPLPAWPLQFFLILLLLFCTGEASFHFEMASVLQGNKHASLSLVFSPLFWFITYCFPSVAVS